MEFSEASEEIKVALIEAARDITVAKINAKGKGFDGYTRYQNWFNQSLNDVIQAIEKN